MSSVTRTRKSSGCCCRPGCTTPTPSRRCGWPACDPGCGCWTWGAGPATSFVAARLVGPEGTVLGIDAAADIIELARTRAAEQGLESVRFEQTTVGDLALDQPVDAVIGRLILMHLPDPVGTLRQLAGLVRPGGFVAFSEFDMSAAPACPTCRSGGQRETRSSKPSLPWAWTRRSQRRCPRYFSGQGWVPADGARCTGGRSRPRGAHVLHRRGVAVAAARARKTGLAPATSPIRIPCCPGYARKLPQAAAWRLPRPSSRPGAGSGITAGRATAGPSGHWLRPAADRRRAVRRGQRPCGPRWQQHARGPPTGCRSG